ncbi:MAG: DNA-processing protein DprA [Rhodoferax sp.]
MERDELAGWLRLQLTPGIGNTSARKLLTAFGLPAQVMGQSVSNLREVLSAAQAQALQQVPNGFDTALESTWNWLQADQQHRRVLTLGDPAYPQALLHIEDPPPLLYALGHEAAFQPGAWADLPCVAIVGSRNPTPQGAANAREFGRALAQAGLTVVSGLALGVDGAAHQGALECPGDAHVATIAVVGTGLDRVYPKQNAALARQIAAHGLLLSEYPLGTPPMAAHFPQRNRIISGLSLGTLVVEAAMQSGSLITARMALEQGKDVFAIPGSIHSTQSRGCHALIKQGAKLVESAQDVMEELGAYRPPATPMRPESAPETQAALPHMHRVLLNALGFEPCSLDTLQARTGMDTANLQAELMALELQGWLVRIPGGAFQRQVQG